MHSPTSERPQFDHFLHCVPDVTAAAKAYTTAGLPSHVNAEHLGFRNGAWRLDARYIELVSIVDRTLFAHSPFGIAMADWMPAIESILAAGGGGCGGGLNFAVHVSDVDATARRLREQGHRVDVHSFRFEATDTSFQEAVLGDAPSWAPFFITYQPHRDRLLELIPPGKINRGAHDLHGMEIQVIDPAGSADWLSRVLAPRRRIRYPGPASQRLRPLRRRRAGRGRGPAARRRRSCRHRRQRSPDSHG